MSPLRLTYDIPHRLFYIYLRPVTGKVGDWQILTAGRMLLDEGGSWIGIEATPVEEEIHDSNAPLPIDLVETLRRPLQVVWGRTVPVQWLEQELILDWDEEGVNGVEVLLFLNNDHVGFDAIRDTGEDIG